MNWCILIPALVGLLCAILGYLLGRLLGGGSNDIDDWKRRNAKLEADLEACRNKLSAKGPSAASTTSSAASSFAATSKSTDSDSSGSSSSAASISSEASGTSSSGASLAAAAAFNADAAKAAFGKKIKQDDLTVVEGIGPKIQGLFHDHDVKTWKALAECSTDECQKVLNSGGKRYQMHNPGSWPMQSKMAYEGKWAELAKWQDEHSRGKA